MSDTHIPEVKKILPSELMEAFRGVDLILHAGDIYVPSVLDDLERIAPVLAAGGDDDYGDMLTDKRVKEKHILKLEGQTLWLVHKRPYSFTLWWQKKEDLYFSRRSSEDPPNIVVFGHTHSAITEDYKGVLLVNPGSATFPDYVPTLGTVALLTISSGNVEARIVQLK